MLLEFINFQTNTPIVLLFK